MSADQLFHLIDLVGLAVMGIYVIAEVRVGLRNLKEEVKQLRTELGSEIQHARSAQTAHELRDQEFQAKTIHSLGVLEGRMPPARVANGE